LNEDVEIVAVVELPESVRAQIGASATDFVMIRPYSSVEVIDESTAALLDQFRQSKTIVDAILAHSRKMRVRPSEVLKSAFPLIQGFILAGVLERCGQRARH
jgi:hypothetical protein